jgi:hypothetical protein
VDIISAGVNIWSDRIGTCTSNVALKAGYATKGAGAPSPSEVHPPVFSEVHVTRS